MPGDCLWLLSFTMNILEESLSVDGFAVRLLPS